MTIGCIYYNEVQITKHYTLDIIIISTTCSSLPLLVNSHWLHVLTESVWQ